MEFKAWGPEGKGMGTKGIYVQGLYGPQPSLPFAQIIF